MKQILKILLIGSVFQFNIETIAQSYGLRFFGQEYEINKRTGLDLSPGTNFKLNREFELSFELSFVKNYNSYFGYIFRIIFNDTINLDLIYENKFGTINTINLVRSDLGNIFSVAVDEDFFYSWCNISLKIDFQNNKLLFGLGDSVNSSGIDGIPLKARFKIFFGQNNYKSIQSTDLPNMNVKNIRVFENERLKYNWLLDDKEGEVALDRISRQEARVKNPFWLYEMHQNWKPLQELVLSGYSQTAFDPKTDQVYIVSPDSLFIYSARDKAIIKKERFKQKINIQTGMELFYDYMNNRLLCRSLDLKKVSVYDTITKNWSIQFPEDIPVGTDYFHNNRFFLPAQNELFVLGGYGQLSYKNEIFRIDMNSLTWDSISDKPDVFTPRYLFGLGINKSSDTIYIIGGYGSETGDQKLNPRYWYDLIRYIPARKTFEKVYEFENHQPENFCFANSIIIDETNQSYYGLVFSKYSYDGELYLVKGSLIRPELNYFGKSIPFTFYDIKSYADLYYSETNQELIAMTSFQKPDGSTAIRIYSLLLPPVPRNEDSTGGDVPKSFPWIFLPGFGIFLTGIGVLIFFRKKKLSLKKSIPIQETGLSPGDSTELKSEKSNSLEYYEEISFPGVVISETQQKSRITLFGGFQAIDMDGIDITSSFTPLIKELFLLILLNSLPGRKGVSSLMLKEILWFDKTDKDARNNRAVNIARLKLILKKIGDIVVSKETGYWKIEFPTGAVYVDYIEYYSIINEKTVSARQALSLLNIAKNGSLLINLEFNWLDDYKSDVSNKVIDTLMKFVEDNIQKAEPNFLIRIADVILMFDSMNEESVFLKCRTLVKLGKHSLANNIFSKFRTEYNAIYNEPYSKSFNEIME